MSNIIAVQSRSMTPVTFQVIIIWSGSEASIPVDWTLCDGSLGTTDLRDRFVVMSGHFPIGYTAGEDSLNLGHNHTVHTPASGGHTHGYTGTTLFDSSNPTIGEPGSVTASTPYEHDISFTSGSATHTHAWDPTEEESESDADVRPPYYALCYIQGEVSDVPINAIVAYTGDPAFIPANFVICDGSSGTPNLEFDWMVYIVGAGDTYTVGQYDYGGFNFDGVLDHEHTGGTVTPSNESHTHGFINILGLPSLPTTDITNADTTPISFIGPGFGTAQRAFHRHDINGTSVGGGSHSHSPVTTGFEVFQHFSPFPDLASSIVACYLMRVS